MDPAGSHDLHLGGGGIFCTADDRAGVSHPPARGCCLTGNKSYNRFFISGFLDPSGSNRFVVSPDLANHYDRIRFIVIHQHLHRLLCRCSDYRIPANADSR